MPEAITDNLDLWSSALLTKSTAGRGSNSKLEAYGIKKLRELILELAVRGKLVPQDPNDEPASVLLERVLKENAQFPSRRGRKSSNNPEITDGDISFELPQGWEYVRNGSLFSLRKGQKPKNISESPIGLPYLDIEALDRGNVLRFTDDDKCPRTTEKDILVVCDGSRSGLVLNGKSGVIGSTLAVIDTPRIIQPFIKLIFRESYERLNSTMKGAAIPHLDTNRLLLEIVGFPPLNEQHRILAKVEELMALCDRLEQQQTHSLEAHQALVASLLGTLTRVESQQEFSEAWARIASHFDTLFTTEASIAQLKQTILQLAVMGKLVPQEPNDEPASVLIAKIATEKVKLIKERKIRSEKTLIDFQGLDELKRPLPNNWQWARLNDIADVVRGGSPRPAGDPRFYDGEIPFLKVADVSRVSGKLVDGFTYTIKEAGLQKTRFINERTVLLTNSGATLGIPAICDFPATFNDGIAAFVQLSSGIFDEYLFLYLKSLSQWFLDIASRGQGQPNLNTDIIKATWFVLPPLAEQHRIVAKVDELMALCDTLKARLADAQAIQLHLADAIVEQATLA